MKRIVVFLMSLMLLFATVPVYAQMEDNDDEIKVECNKLSDHDVPYTTTDENGKEITVYTISAVTRGYDQKIHLPVSRYFTLTSQKTDLSEITAEMDTVSDHGQGKKDIRLKINSKSVNRAEIEANFSSQTVTTQLNANAKILIKNKDGVTIKEIALSYSTPALTDEHDAPQFHTLSAWSGKSKYDYETGETYKISGMVDVYQTSAKLSYTYQSLGTFGVKQFMLDSPSNFTFSNGKTTYTAKYGNPKQKNTITLKCKSSYLKYLKKQLSYDFCKYGISTEAVIFNDVSLEYKNVAGKIYENGISDNGQGCTIGGSMDPINLAHYATVKPQKTVPIKSYKKTRSTITLKWKKTSDPISGYMIYRSKKKSSGYKKIKTVSSKTTSYKNTKLKRKTTYYYKIRPYRNVTYTYTTKNKKKKTLSRKAYGNYSSAKKIKTSK